MSFDDAYRTTASPRLELPQGNSFPKKLDRGDDDDDDDVEGEVRASLRIDALQLHQVHVSPLQSRLAAQGGSNSPTTHPSARQTPRIERLARDRALA